MVTNPVLSWWKTDMCGKWSSIVIVKIGLISFRPQLFFLPFSISICFRWFRFYFVFISLISFRFCWFRFASFRFVFVDFVSFRFVSFRFRWFRFVSFRFYFVSHFIGTRLFTIQFTFLLYFPILFTIFFCIFHIVSLFNLGFFHIFPTFSLFKLLFFYFFHIISLSKDIIQIEYFKLSPISRSVIITIKCSWISKIYRERRNEKSGTTGKLDRVRKRWKMQSSVAKIMHLLCMQIYHDQ